MLGEAMLITFRQMRFTMLQDERIEKDESSIHPNKLVSISDKTKIRYAVDRLGSFEHIACMSQKVRILVESRAEG
jgi:hypothetical protein